MTEKNQGNQAVRLVYAITEKGQETFWTKVGVAFPPNRDGSINLELDAVPVGNGRLQVRDRWEPQPEPTTPPERKRRR